MRVTKAAVTRERSTTVHFTQHQKEHAREHLQSLHAALLVLLEVGGRVSSFLGTGVGGGVGEAEDTLPAFPCFRLVALIVICREVI